MTPPHIINAGLWPLEYSNLTPFYSKAVACIIMIFRDFIALKYTIDLSNLVRYLWYTDNSTFKCFNLTIFVFLIIINVDIFIPVDLTTFTPRNLVYTGICNHLILILSPNYGI